MHNSHEPTRGSKRRSITFRYTVVGGVRLFSLSARWKERIRSVTGTTDLQPALSDDR